MLISRAVIYAKLESAYGTDPTPTSGDAVLCESPTIEPIGRRLERNNTKSYFGTLAPVNVGEAVEVSFTTEIRGSGTAGTAPEVGPLWEACGFTHTNVPGTSDTYAPNSNLESSQASVAIYFYRHNILHKALGCRGTVTAEVKSGEYGKLNWTFRGLYAGPTDSSIGSGTYDSTIPPKFVSASFSIGAYSGIIESLKFDVGNEIGKRVSANASTGVLSYFIKERAVKGEINPEVVALSTWDPHTLWSNSTTQSITATIGSTAGNRCVITGPAVVLDSVKYAERDSLLTYSIPLIFTPSSGNDEISIAYT